MTTYELQQQRKAQRCFAERHFGNADLGHQARNDSLLRLARNLSRHPGGTLPHKLRDPADYKSMVRLANRPEVTHGSVLGQHYQNTHQEMQRSPGVVLVLHDTTELDYSGLKETKGLGQIGNGGGRGYLCHNSLAVDPQSREVLGLAHQILHVRAQVPKKESVTAKRKRKDRESRLWSTAVQAISQQAGNHHQVDVCDRGSDLFEFLANEDDLGRDFVVRASHSRSMRPGHDGEADKRPLFQYARSLKRQGTMRQKTVQTRVGRSKQKAKVCISFAPVQLLPPHVKRGEYEKRPLPLWVVRIWEPNPPKGAQRLEWILLTSVPVESVDDAWQRGDWYECRWIIEEYHKAQKTGCGIEQMQFGSVEALQPMIAIQSVIALLLMRLRDLSRHPEAKQRDATEVIDRAYVDVLSAWRYKKVREMTIHEFFRALARLGGHQNRKNDSQPGWLVFWRGWTSLQLLLEGAEIWNGRQQHEEFRG